MKLPAIRRNKCDLLKMIKMVHKRSTWGKKYIYATNDKHAIYVEVERLDFRKGIIYFGISFENIYTKHCHSNIRETEVKYHMGKTDDSVEKLERRINKSIIVELEDCLEWAVESVVLDSEGYMSLYGRHLEDEENYREIVTKQYENDRNADIIIDALVDDYTHDLVVERRTFKSDYIFENKEEHRKELHKRYIEMLKNEDD